MIKTFVKSDNHVINHVIQSKRVQEDGVASYLGLSSVLTILLDMALRYRTSQILNYLSFQKKKCTDLMMEANCLLVAFWPFVLWAKSIGP